MTREEFRDYVESLRSQNKVSYDVYSGLIDGIDTLEQEPCENAISRQALLDEAFEVDTKEYGRIDVVGVDVIDALPPITSQLKTGHWIEDEYEMEVRCSVCGEENDMCSKYCPNCGTKMIEPQESEEI